MAKEGKRQSTVVEKAALLRHFPVEGEPFGQRAPPSGRLAAGPLTIWNGGCSLSGRWTSLGGNASPYLY